MTTIRTCRPEDFPEILPLLRQLWPAKAIDGASLQNVFSRVLQLPTRIYLCAVNDGQIVGLGSLTIKDNLWQDGQISYVEELVVGEAHRGRGIGTLLLDELVALSRKQGCRRIELDSAFHRKEAHQFYEKHGFENRAFLFSKVL
jgi:GNAT superfamily N-acetyltransferase